MTTVDCSGDVASHTQVGGLLLVSRRDVAAPPIANGHIAQYSDGHTAPPGGSVTVPADPSLAVNTGVKWSPFYRGDLVIDFLSIGSGNVVGNVTYPTDAVPGDLAVLFVANTYTDVTAPSGWSVLWGDTTTRRWVWTHVIAEGEPGTRALGVIPIGFSTLSTIGAVYGNAVAGRIVTDTNLTTRTLTTPALSVGSTNAACMIWWAGGGDSTFTTSGPGIENVQKIYRSNASSALVMANVVSPTANLNTFSTTSSGTVSSPLEVAVELVGVTVFPFADVALQEAVGPDQDVVDIVDDITLLGADLHSEQGIYGYAAAPLDGSGTVYSYERWVRLRVAPGFNTLTDVRFWVPNGMPDGWTVSWGSTDTYSAPVNTASSVATNSLPTSDPGRAAPNFGSSRLIGTETQYSDWLVLQATVDTSVANSGPIMGFSAEGALFPISIQFAWVET